MSLSSPTVRAAITLALVAGFYVLALSLVGLLLVIPYWQLTHTTLAGLKVGLACLGAAFVILRGICPRREPNNDPGPRLSEERQPKLFSFLRQVAEATGQSMPKNVYLLAEVNAYVAQRGGFLGIGSRRVMGIGLPLMQLLTERQFQSVIAHEFGHFEAGDTKLAALSGQGHRSIERTLAELAARDSWLQKPVLWYGKLFNRAMNALSRRQEFSADALAARIAGPSAMKASLVQVRKGGLATVAFWQQELAPLLNEGLLPPVANGFSRFLTAPPISAAVEAAIKASEGAEPDPYATHPPLAARLAALDSLAPGAQDEEQATPAIGLLCNLRDEERRLVEFILPQPKHHRWQPIEWEQAGEQGYLTIWKSQLAQNRNALAGISLSDLFELCANPQKVIQQLRTPGELPPRAELQNRALFLIVSALSVRLHELGWTLTAEVGEPIYLRNGEQQITPVVLIRELAKKQMSRSKFDALGLPDAKLVADSLAAAN